MCAAAFGVALMPTSAEASICPPDGRYATNGAGQAFCLFENITLPEAQNIAPYCHWLDYGYIGFSWDEAPANASYVCPDGSYNSTNGAGSGFCVYDNLSLPEADALTPYCHWLEYGYIGYHWDICPEGSRYAENGAGDAFCLFENIALPEANDVAPYCHWLEYGYLGFSWTESAATASYQCPAGARQTDNGAGVGFCLFEDLWLDDAPNLAPYCDYLEKGYLGYSWSL